MFAGEMLAQMPGHASYAHLKLCEKCPYILSYGSFDIEGCVKLWAKATYECVANFTLDTMVSAVLQLIKFTFFFDPNFFLDPFRSGVTLILIVHQFMTYNH